MAGARATPYGFYAAGGGDALAATSGGKPKPSVKDPKYKGPLTPPPKYGAVPYTPVGVTKANVARMMPFTEDELQRYTTLIQQG